MIRLPMPLSQRYALLEAGRLTAGCARRFFFSPGPVSSLSHFRETGAEDSRTVR